MSKVGDKVKVVYQCHYDHHSLKFSSLGTLSFTFSVQYLWGEGGGAMPPLFYIPMIQTRRSFPKSSSVTHG